MKIDRSNHKVFDQYLSARNDFLRGHYLLATKKLLPINLVTDSKDVNHLLVNSLYHQGDYREAERILLEDVNSYTATDNLINLMINVLLRNNEFIICYEIIASFEDQKTSQRLLKMVKRREGLVELHQAKDISKIAKTFYHLSGVSLIRQRIILKKAQHLPLTKFIMIAKRLLVDPFLAPIMRLSILDILRKVNLKTSLKYMWIDQKIYSVDLKRLSDLTKTKSYRAVMKYINSKYFQNPSRMVALKQILRLDLSYLYPFNDRKVRDVPLWVKIAALRLEGKQPIFSNHHVERVYYLQVKLNQLTKNLIK